MTISTSDQIAAEVINRPADEWLLDLYLPYAHYTIRDRALLLEDGFKPVNRRILWSLFTNGITPRVKHRKAARAAGDTAAYHPHGGASIEDALARMAQGFIQRVPLIDPQGSVGKVAGDTAAAARYWECRLNEPAMELLKELNEGALELGRNFDGTMDEPNRLPVRWPVSIINGSQGIAVGYAAKLWPHNPSEVMKAAIALVENPELKLEKLLKIMPGPDFPTGGELVGTDGVKEYYENGSGTFTIRGRYNVEQLPRGRSRITFYELPYQTSAETVIEAINKAKASNRGKMNDIGSVKDLTDKKNGLRLVIETKSGSNLSAILFDLFKMTPVQVKFPTNSTVIVDGAPVVQGMLEQLQNFVNFRRMIIANKAEFRLTKLNGRISQLDAILAALLDIDKAIKIIRKSESATEAQEQLSKAFKITSEQADYILSMPLRRLTKADSVSINEEKVRLRAEQERAKEIISSDDTLDEQVKIELNETLKIIKDNRRTIISGMTTDDAKAAEKELVQDAKSLEKDLPCYITRLADGRLLKTDERDVYKAEDKSLLYGAVIETIKTTTQADIVVVFADGNAKKINPRFLPFGTPVSKTDLGLDGYPEIVGLSKLEQAVSEIGLAIVTALGEVKIAKTDFPNKEEFPVITLSDGDSVVSTLWVARALTDKRFVLTSKAGNVLAFDATSIRVSGSKAGGVKGMKLKDSNDRVIGFSIIGKKDDATIISVASKTIKSTPLTDIPLKNKGGMGVALHAYRAGEKEHLKDVYTGATATAVMKGTSNVISLPPQSKRAARGSDFGLQVSLGSIIAPNN